MPPYQRTDRGLDSLGKVADLVPMESPLRLFADGQLGSQTFMLVGMAQLRHGAGGITQEWYAKFSGSWGWLAEARGIASVSSKCLERMGAQ